MAKTSLEFFPSITVVFAQLIRRHPPPTPPLSATKALNSGGASYRQGRLGPTIFVKALPRALPLGQRKSKKVKIKSPLKFSIRLITRHLRGAMATRPISHKIRTLMMLTRLICVVLYNWLVDGVLADRTNGRAYATVLRLSVTVCRLWRYVLWLNGGS